MLKKTLILTFTLLFLFSSISCFAADSTSSEGSGGDDSSGIVGMLLDGIKGLFIPDDEFFEDFQKEISDAWENKVGGLTRTWTAITDQFTKFNKADEDLKLEIEFKDNHFFEGYKGTKADLFGGMGDFAKWFKGLCSGLVVVYTIYFCYKKIISMVQH